MGNPLDLPTTPGDQPEPTTTHANELTGRTLGDFHLIRLIGQGGMGQVYLAQQLSLKRQVAVKILRADLSANIAALQRFQLEAEAVAKITHASIVQVYAIGAADGLNYMALEYVEGRNLRDYINRKGPPELPICINIMRQVAAALQRAGELGFVHRDIKPENILLTRKGEVKVADFGLSRCFAGDQAPLNITQSGVTMGTPLYMSPEQVKGLTVDPRSDIYSFGVTAYHMLAGEPPFRGESPFEVALQHVQREPRPLGEIRPDLPTELCAIVRKMMAKKLEDRYQTAREILRDLTRMKAGRQRVSTQTASAQTAIDAGGLGRDEPPPLSATSETQPIPRWPARWKRWALIGFLFLGAVSVGAAIHWKTRPAAASKTIDPGSIPAEDVPNPARVAENERLRLLNSRESKSDLDVANALLDLGMLYIHEKRFEDALFLFDKDSLNKRPAIAGSLKKSALPPQWLDMISVLGTGIVLAHQDEPDKSIEKFELEMKQPPKIKGGSRQPVDLFLFKNDRWKKAVADALERNAKNNRVNTLGEQLNRYRFYSKF